VPDLYVQIVPPQNLVINGVPTDVIGVVGTASWGPINQPAIVATMSDYASQFGPVVARQHDMGTQVATAVQQGAQNFRCVRVTDGTDTAATTLIQSPDANDFAMMLTAGYSGTLGNQLVATVGVGSQANTWRLTISLPGLQPELFDNIPGTGAQLWANMVNAVNNGLSLLRGPSQLVTAQPGQGTPLGSDARRQRRAAAHRPVCAARAGLLDRAARRRRRSDAVDHAGGVRSVRRRLHDPDGPGG